jgi:type II secretory pathway pseudopilin PulG
MKNSKKYIKTYIIGFSIIEMLIAVGVFAIIGVVVANSLASSFKNSKKSIAVSNVKGNIDYAMSTMERLLRNAQTIDPASTATKLIYTDEKGKTTYFECVSSGTPPYIASGSATVKLTSDQVKIECSNIFSYPAVVPGVPQVVEITLKGTDKNSGSSAEGSSVTSRSRILLRNYIN